MSRKVISLLLTLFVCMSFLTGCGGKEAINGSNVDQTSEKKQVSGEFVLPLTDKSIELTIATSDNGYAPASLTTGLAVWKEIEKKTNVKIKWEVQPGGQYITAIQTRLAASSNLPDIVKLPGTNPTPYGQSGTVIPLNELIDQYAPNIRRLFEEKPLAKKLMTSGDGNMYGLAAIVEGASKTQPYGFQIRQDWLDKLQLSMPQNLDDWYNVLKTFAQGDPNGNNKKDEIGFATDPVSAFAGAFDLKLFFTDIFAQGFWANEDNKVFYQWIDPKLKELLAYANKLYMEGLIDPDYGNPSAEGIDAKVTKDRVGSMQMWLELGHNWQNILHAAGITDARYVMAPPPAGPYSKGILEEYGMVDPGFTAITKSCKNKEIAIKWLDYVFASKEGQMYQAWGIENETYIIKDGKPQFTDFVLKNADGLGPSDGLRSKGAWGTICWVQQPDTYIQILSANPDFASAGKQMEPYYVLPFPFLLGNKDEDDITIPIMNDIATYRAETIAKFIMGLEPIDNFDKYVEKIKEMKIEEVLKIKQSQYEKFLKN